MNTPMTSRSIYDWAVGAEDSSAVELPYSGGRCVMNRASVAL